MARRPPSAGLLPILGFAVALGGALLMTHRAASDPGARLYQHAVAYLEALRAGDANAIAAAAGPVRPPEPPRAHRTWGELAWFVSSLEVAPGGEEGAVTVLWLGDGGGLARAHLQRWGRAPDGRWRLLEIERQDRPRPFR